MSVQKVIFICFLFAALVNLSYGLQKFYDTEFQPYSEDGLPPLYNIEDSSKCNQQTGAYCKVEVFIQPRDEQSELARQIRESQVRRYRFHRSSIYRMMCVPKQHIETNTIRDYIRDIHEDQLLKDYNITAEVPNYQCNFQNSINIFDLLLGISAILFVWFIYKSTTYDLKRRKEPNFPKSKYDKWLKIFSIKENWEKVTARNNNPDFQRLKSIQGIRFFNTILVIACHTKLSFAQLFIDNPTDLEWVASKSWFYLTFQSDLFIVQIYFMISTFLLTNQVYELHKKHGYFSLGHCINLYLNRIARFFPTMLVVVLFTITGIKIMPQDTVALDFIIMCWKGCASNWWSTLFQMNFIHTFTKMCMAGTWYISVDTFLYGTAIFMLYFQLKFKLDMKKVVAVAFFFMSLLFGYTIYVNDSDIMYRPAAEHIRRVFDDPDFNRLYISPISSWSSGCVGVAMGAIYFHIKNKEIKLNPVIQVIWLLTFLFLPALVVIASTYTYPGIVRAIVGPLMKPGFALGFGIGILGMSKGYGGIVKKIFEWDFATKMSNFTYCTYVFHFFLVFSRGIYLSGMAHFSLMAMLLGLIQDIILSFLLGILMTITIEYPGLTLQKMYVPQIKKPDKPKSNGIELK